MIVGAGFGQLPAILKAKQMGLKVITIDKNPNAPGMQKADVSLEIDVIDKEKAIQAARDHKIDGIMTMQSDLPMPTIGAVVDALKLAGVSYDVANTCSNKIKTRQLFGYKTFLSRNLKLYLH